MNNEEIALTLKNISFILRVLYKKLAYIEINNKLDTDEYKKVLSLVNFYISLEDVYYNEIFLRKSCDDILEINAIMINDFASKAKIGSYLDEDLIMSGFLDDDELIIMRCFRKLFIIFAKLDCKDILDGSINYMIEKTNNERNNIFLGLIEKEASNLSLPNRNSLVETKYDLGFIFKNEEYINHNDIIAEVGAELKISEDICRAGKTLSNIVLKDEMDTRNVTMLVSYIKASLCFMSEDDVFIIQDTFYSYLEHGFITDGYGFSLFNQLLDDFGTIKKDYLNGKFTLKRKY